MNKHTPGPWFWTRRTLGWKGWQIWDAEPDNEFEGARGSCTVAQEVRSDADARLIAAAPDLLEALKELATWAESTACLAVESSARIHGVTYAPEDVACWDRARAAIAKAEGKP